MKRVAGILGAAFLVGLGLAIGNSMSTEAMGVVVGVVLGVAAAVPMSLLVMALATRREEPKQEQPPQVLIVDSRNIPQYPTETYYAGGKWREIPRKGLN